MSQQQKRIANQAAGRLQGVPHNVGGMALTASQSRTIFSGPLPHPDILAKYDQVVPGTAARLIETAQKQGEHRMDLEKTVIKGDNFRANRGMVFAFTLALVLIGSGTSCVLLGHDLAGASIIGTSLVSLIAAFLSGSSGRRREREEKARIQASLSQGKNPSAIQADPQSSQLPDHDPSGQTPSPE
jgi:uncharacterized membrane protein